MDGTRRTDRTRRGCREHGSDRRDRSYRTHWHSRICGQYGCDRTHGCDWIQWSDWIHRTDWLDGSNGRNGTDGVDRTDGSDGV